MILILIGIFLLFIIYLIGNIYLTELSFDDYSKPDDKNKVYNTTQIVFARITNIISFIIIFLIMMVIFSLYKYMHKNKDDIFKNSGKKASNNEILNYFFVYKIAIFMIGIFSAIYLIGNIFLSILAFDDYSKINEKKKNYNIFNIFFARFATIFSWFILILFFIFCFYLAFMFKYERNLDELLKS